MAEDTVCSPEQLAEKIRRREEFCLLDVRTAPELNCAKIDGATHIPLNELPQRINDLALWRDKPIVVMCHHGLRSEMAQQFLSSQGFKRVQNLNGGIDAYAAQVDSSVGRY